MKTIYLSIGNATITIRAVLLSGGQQVIIVRRTSLDGIIHAALVILSSMGMNRSEKSIKINAVTHWNLCHISNLAICSWYKLKKSYASRSSLLWLANFDQRLSRNAHPEEIETVAR